MVDANVTVGIKVKDEPSERVLDQATVEVKMLTNLAGSYGSAQAGQKIRLTARQARELIEGGCAEPVPDSVNTEAVAFADLFEITHVEPGESKTHEPEKPPEAGGWSDLPPGLEYDEKDLTEEQPPEQQDLAAPKKEKKSK